MKQTIKVPDTLNATGFDAIQTYNYDELNRLKSAEEKINNVTSWKQTYTFDRYGNRRFDETNTDTLQGGCATAVCNPTIDPATNKLVGYTFDNAGNTKVDANGQTFTYDAENKQILVKDSSNNTVGEYFYDGDGKRIKKITNGEETIFVYNASGQLVAEYTNQTPQNTPRVSYLTSDHLGSPRITTDADGDVYTRRDFMPFGEEIDSDDTSQRTATLNYASDEIKQKFTSYERDNETDLDFAQARMHNYSLGRFTSPDIVAGEMLSPQSLNKYLYVRNNPLRLTDSTGMIVEWEDSKKKKKKGEKDARTKAQRKYENNLDKMINSENKEERKRGLKLKADYDRLRQSDIVFHVRDKKPPKGDGELRYEGKKGHLYVDIKADSSVFGSLTIIQKLAHEFKHGTQFLDGELGFYKKPNGKWSSGFANDLYDESEAMIAGFEADSINGFQMTQDANAGTFFREINAALPKGQGAVISVMKNNGTSPYRNYSDIKVDIRGMPKSEGYYGIPKKKEE